MVVDTSAILAIYFNELHGPWPAEQLQTHAGQLRMSTVNLTEALIRIRDHQPARADELQDLLLNSEIRFIPPDERQAKIAADARLRFPINLGDCFAYALARVEGCSILAIDQDFRAVDVPLVLPAKP